MSTETGGPAFPHVHLPVPGYDPYEVRQTLTGGGMTLRDYFAAKAMQALILRDEPCISRDSYRLADLMLKERAE